jgi:sorting nexin-25
VGGRHSKSRDVLWHVGLTFAPPDGRPNEPLINGERIETLETFLERLYVAKRKVEKRITLLGGTDDSVEYQSTFICIPPLI